MERKEILEKLKTTEAEVKEKIEQTQHKRNEILTAAQRQARKLEEDGDKRIKAERETLLAAAKKDIDTNRKEILKKATNEAEELKKKAQVKKTKEFFVTKFEEHLHV
jgi:vacuolar-type H+-ATPase subunit H